jgi:MFS family permease
MRGTFRALRSRNYRLFFGGQTLSLIGTWMQSVAMSWLVYRVTGSEFLLGVVTFAQQIPMFLVSPLAGMYTDRVDRRKLLILTQSLQAVQALVLSVLVFVHAVKVWEIVVLSIFVGIVNAFDTPGRQAFVIEMVEHRDDLPNAIALNSTQFNIARLVGPAIAGGVIKVTGEGVCFLINAISFLAVIGSLLLIRVAPRGPRVEATQAWGELVDGGRYVAGHRPILALLSLLAVVSLVSGSYQVLLPAMAKEVYHGDSGTLGLLYGAVGAGALVSAILLASRQSVLGLTRWIVMASGVFSISQALFGLAPNFWLGCLALVGVGFGAMLHMGSTNTMIQTMVEDRMRGRVMAFYAMSFVGTMPIGSLITGAISKHVGPTPTLLGAGLLGLLATTVFGRYLPHIRRHIRPIYESKGILDPVIAKEE